MWYHLILTHMSRLWPRKEPCVFYSVMVAYGFDVEVRHCKFCEDFDSFRVSGCFEILVWESYKYIFLELKKMKKKHSNWLFMKLAIFFFNFVLEFIICRSLCKFILLLFCAVWAIVIKTEINGDLKVFFTFFKDTKAQLKMIEFW